MRKNFVNLSLFLGLGCFVCSCVTHGVVHHAKAAKTMGEVLTESANQIQTQAKADVEKVLAQQEEKEEQVRVQAKRVFEKWEAIAELQRVAARIHAEYVEQLLKMVDSDQTEISAKMAWTAKELLRTYVEFKRVAEQKTDLKLMTPSLELQKVVANERR